VLHFVFCRRLEVRLVCLHFSVVVRFVLVKVFPGRSALRNDCGDELVCYCSLKTFAARRSLANYTDIVVVTVKLRRRE